MEKEKIRETIINTYLKNEKNIDKTMEVLSTLPEPLNTLTKKQIQGILVFAKIWEAKPKTKQEVNKRVTKKDLLPQLEKLGVNTTGLADATVEALKNLLEFLKTNLKDG